MNEGLRYISHGLTWSLTRSTRQSLYPLIRTFSTLPSSFAATLPLTAAGPPPSAPVPAASQYGERIERRRRQAALLQKGRELKGGSENAQASLKKRFWKDVTVDKAPDGTYTVHLSGRPLKHPMLKAPLPIPQSKLHIATAIALEWDLLTSAQDALRSHLIPITSLAARAHSILMEDADGISSIRDEIVANLIRYLDTDTLLSWSPSPGTATTTPFSSAASFGEPDTPKDTLRDIQIKTATPILEYLSTYLWPGVKLQPTFSSPESIMPTPQHRTTVAVIKGWMTGLSAWNLAGLERAVLAGKSLCIAARLVGEWGEDAVLGSAEWRGETPGKRFGIEEAAEASSLEVRWQTDQWGEVEDSHDVEKEDLRRQFGMVVLCVTTTNVERA